jgi:peroxiredoxin
MNKRLVLILALAAAAAIYLVVRRPAAAGGGASFTNIASHPEAPQFALPLLDGGTLRLANLRGKVVLLDFWATWCEPCQKETPGFVALQKKYDGQGLQIIGISMDDSSEPVRDFYKKFEMNYPVVMGDAHIGESYGGVLGLPIAFLIGRDQRIYARHIGATDIAVFDFEIQQLLHGNDASGRPAK